MINVFFMKKWLYFKNIVKLAFYVTLITFISCFCYGDIIINEIMYNPEGNDNNKEFIEVFSEERVNLSEYIIEDSKSEDSLELLSYYNSSYSLIVEKDFNYTGINASIYSAGATIGDNLNNEEDIILLRDKNGNILDVVFYCSSWGAKGNGASLERINAEEYSNDPDNWIESYIEGGTPGKDNSVSKKGGCDWKISVIIDSIVSDDPEWQIRASKIEGEGKANITVAHWIEDSFGRVIKTYSDINIEDALSRSTSSKYSPSLTKGNGYFIKANITQISCEDKDNIDNFVSELIFIQDEENTLNLNSSINIQDIPGTAKFGDVIKVKIDVYRGDTSKYAVYAYTIDNGGKIVSEKSTMHFKNKFTNYTVSIPIQLDANCDEKYEQGDYIIVVEGLDNLDEKRIYIESGTSSLCRTIEIEKEDKKSKKLSYDIREMPYAIYLNESFNVVLEIENDDEDDVELEVWSYVYRGNKKYSGELDNLKYISVDGEDTKEVILENKVIEGDEGNYKLKAKVKKKGRKTSYDKTKEVYLKVPEKVFVKSEKEDLLVGKGDDSTEGKEDKVDEMAGRIIRDREVIYESEAFFTRKFANAH